MIRRMTFFVLLIVSLTSILSGCATTTFDVGKADRNVTPRETAQTPAIAQGREVAWGGTIVNGKNLTNDTQLEVVAYPLDHGNRPRQGSDPLGRFIIVHPGYLETADYAPGRQITAVGTVTETRAGKVGEATYVYPVVNASRVHLWPVETQPPAEPRFHFGIGVGIIR